MILLYKGGGGGRGDYEKLLRKNTKKKIPPTKLKVLFLQHGTLWWQPIYSLQFLESKWSFS